MLVGAVNEELVLSLCFVDNEFESSFHCNSGLHLGGYCSVVLVQLLLGICLKEGISLADLKRRECSKREFERKLEHRVLRSEAT